MDWIRSLRQAFDILTLRRSSIQAVAGDPKYGLYLKPYLIWIF